MSTAQDLSVRGLCKSYGHVPVLCGVDLSVHAGTLTAILGPSGCGKTTLLRLIAGLERPDEGTVAVGDTVVADRAVALPPERRGLGYVAQEGAIFPHLDVAGNVGFGLPRAKRRSGRVEEMLDLVGLSGLGRRLPHQLSGGQQQRVALARALAPAPALVLLDEPFAALDAGLRATMRADVRAALSATGTTALLVTHDQTEALSLADRVAVLRRGRLVQNATPQELYRTPVDTDVAGFVGQAMLLPGRARDGFAECVLGRLPLPAAQRGLVGGVTVLVRPEQLACTVAANGGLCAEVSGVTYYGHDADLHLRLPDSAGDVPPLTARLSGPGLPVGGERVAVHVVGEVVAYPADPPDPGRLATPEHLPTPDPDTREAAKSDVSAPDSRPPGCSDG